MAATRKAKTSNADQAAALAKRLSEALVEARVVPRFVDSYVVENGRYALQVHPGLYRDLLTLLQREALLAASAQALEIASSGAAGKRERRSTPTHPKDASAFRQKFLAALTRQQNWNMGAALEFQSDLQIYHDRCLRVLYRLPAYAAKMRRRGDFVATERAEHGRGILPSPRHRANVPAQLIFSTWTAVPYASTSVTPCITSLAS
jgi:hypothetical protein